MKAMLSSLRAAGKLALSLLYIAALLGECAYSAAFMFYWTR